MAPDFRRFVEASGRADLPWTEKALLSAAVDALVAAGLQWTRFLEAQSNPPDFPASLWMIELHFFLVAADNARDRFVALAERLDDDEFRSIVDLLVVQEIKDFRNNQEHFEERVPKGPRQGKAKMAAPGNEAILIEDESATVWWTNNLVNGRLQFGNQEVDLQDAANRVAKVAEDLTAWLEKRRG